jgi:hypothetical protein
LSLILGCGAANACTVQDAWVELRTEAPEAAALGARVVRLDQGGCLEIAFPPQDLRHGMWSRTVDEQALADLRDGLAQLDFDQQALDAAFADAREGHRSLLQRHLVVDGERRELRWHDGVQTHELSAYALNQTLRSHPEVSQGARLSVVVGQLEALAQSLTLQRDEQP